MTTKKEKTRNRKTAETGTFAASIGSLLTAGALWYTGSKPEAVQLASTAVMAILLRRGMIK
jgi:hypothetical protein